MYLYRNWKEYRLDHPDCPTCSHSYGLSLSAPMDYLRFTTASRGLPRFATASRGLPRFARSPEDYLRFTTDSKGLPPLHYGLQGITSLCSVIPWRGGFKAKEKLFAVRFRSSFHSIEICTAQFFIFRLRSLKQAWTRLSENKKPDFRRAFPLLWRRERDSNPRCGYPAYRLSRSALSTTQTPLRLRNANVGINGVRSKYICVYPS